MQNATRMATCMFVTCIGTAITGIGTTTGLITTSIVITLLPARNFFCFSLIFWESFLLIVFLAIRLSFCLFHLIFQTRQYTFYYPKILFPKASLKIFSKHQAFLLQNARMEVFLFAGESLRLLLRR